MFTMSHCAFCGILQAELRAKSATTDTLPPVPGLPEVLGGRKPIPSVGAGALESSNLADLEGLLPHEEVMEAKVSMAMQRLLQHPKLCYMARTFNDQSPNHMYA